MMRSLLAKLGLAWAFLIHVLKRAFFWKKGGYQQFIKNYHQDGSYKLTTIDKDYLEKFARCFNCGLCDCVCPALETLPWNKFPGPSALMVAFIRSSTGLWDSKLDMSLCRGCQVCGQICPNQVPIHDALDFIEAKVTDQMWRAA